LERVKGGPTKSPDHLVAPAEYRSPSRGSATFAPGDFLRPGHGPNEGANTSQDICYADLIAPGTPSPITNHPSPPSERSSPPTTPARRVLPLDRMARTPLPKVPHVLPPPDFGIRVADVWDDVGGKMAVVALEIQVGGLSYYAGIQVGDILCRWNSLDLKSAAMFMKLADLCPSPATIGLQVTRRHPSGRGTSFAFGCHIAVPAQ